MPCGVEKSASCSGQPRTGRGGRRSRRRRLLMTTMTRSWPRPAPQNSAPASWRKARSPIRAKVRVPSPRSGPPSVRGRGRGRAWGGGARRQAQRGRHRPVDAAGTAVADHPQPGPRQHEAVQVADRHARPGEEGAPSGRQAARSRATRPSKSSSPSPSIQAATASAAAGRPPPRPAARPGPRRGDEPVRQRRGQRRPGRSARSSRRPGPGPPPAPGAVTTTSRREPAAVASAARLVGVAPNWITRSGTWVAAKPEAPSRRLRRARAGGPVRRPEVGSAISGHAGQRPPAGAIAAAPHRALGDGQAAGQHQAALGGADQLGKLIDQAGSAGRDAAARETPPPASRPGGAGPRSTVTPVGDQGLGEREVEVDRPGTRPQRGPPPRPPATRQAPRRRRGPRAGRGASTDQRT